MKNKKTNAMRILDRNKIKYEYYFHDVDEHDIIGYQYFADNHMDLKTIYKTLVLTAKDGENIVAMIPINQELDLKKLAKASKHKAVAMLPQKDLLPLTGYVHGGCSPLGMKKTFNTFIQKDALDLKQIYFSAGKVGGQIKLCPTDLIDLLKIIVCDITK